MKVEVIRGDCREVVPTLGKFDFIFADPPFGIGQDYNDFDDTADMLDKLIPEAIEVCWEACDGILALHGSDDMADRYVIEAHRLGMKKIDSVIWHYRFGQCGRSKWINAHCRCLIFAKHDSWTWNPEEVLVDSDRKTKYADKRIHETENGGQRSPGTVWGIPSDGSYWGRVNGNSAERCAGHPNQLPEVYLERLIRAYTNRGDRVIRSLVRGRRQPLQPRWVESA